MSLPWRMFLFATFLGAITPLPRAETLGPLHIAKLRVVTAAIVSPDGTEVAYLLSVPRQPMVDDDGPAFVELHVVNARGESRPFITGKVTVSDVEWTPAGK